VKDLYNKKYKTLMKENEKDTKNWKTSHVSGLEKISNVKVSILHKAICRFNVIFTKIPMVLFTKPYIHMEVQRPWRPKAILSKKNIVEATENLV
jgi:hypothetical protein